MTATITSKIEKGPIVIHNDDGSRIIYERRVTTCDDWRAIPGIGMCNFGWVSFGPLVQRTVPAQP